jgi:hypothetical protein
MTDERRDDEILGRALSRAIETIDLNQTPFERSRIATQPPKRGFFPVWQLATGAVAIVLALAIGSWLTRPTDGQPGVAASPTASSVTATSASTTPTPTPAPTATPLPTLVDHARVYFARDGLPPVSQHFDASGDPGQPDMRIKLRLGMLLIATPASSGSFTAIPPRTSIAVNTVRISGDTATVDFTVSGGDWGVRGSGQSLALMQQLVYTATEEPGIHRVLITQNGGAPATIDQFINPPVTARAGPQSLTREDVLGYTYNGAVGVTQGISWAGDDTIPHVVAKLTNVVNDGTTTRLTFQGTSGIAATPAALPSVSIALESNDDTKPVGGKTAAALNGGKYQLRVDFQWNGGGTSGGIAGTDIFDQTPLRAIIGANPTTLIELDDARPWRAWMPDKTQLVIEIGGEPRATSDRISVTAPKAGDIVNSGASLRVTGSARVFEGNVVWRVLDSTANVVANGHFLASLGSSAMWGAIATSIQMPANVRGRLTLELYEASPKDGSVQGGVQIPLSVR